MYNKRIRTLVGIMLIMAIFLGTTTVSMANGGNITLTLSPSSAINPVGTEHTVVATFAAGGIPLPNLSVKIAVIEGPNNGTSASTSTDAFGRVTMTYADTGGVGLDKIQATGTIPIDGGSDAIFVSDIATKEWVPVNLTLSPLTATNPVGTTHTVTATLTEASKPLPNQSVTIEVIDGPNAGDSFNGVTDASGQVAFTYADTLAGIDTIRAEASIGRDHRSDVIFISNNVTKEWFVPIEGFMTGGGSIFDRHGDRVTHGFELQCNKTKNPNNLEVNWNGNKFHLEELTSARCFDNPSIEPNPPKAGFDTYKGSGIGRYNGVDGATASWKFTDAGEPGKDDTASITIKDANNNTVLSVSGNIDKGNQQAHK